MKPNLLLWPTLLALAAGCPSKPVATRPAARRRAAPPPRRVKSPPMTVARARALLTRVKKAIVDAKEGLDTDLKKLLGPHIAKLPAPCATRGQHGVTSFYLSKDDVPEGIDADPDSDDGGDDDPGGDPGDDPEADPNAPPSRARPRARKAKQPKDAHLPGLFIINVAKQQPRCGRAKVHPICAVTLTRKKGRLQLVATGLSGDGQSKPTGDRFDPKWRGSATGYNLLLLSRDGDQPCMKENPHDYDPPTDKTLEVYCYRNGSFDPLHTFTVHKSSFTDYGGDSEKAELDWHRVGSPAIDVVAYKLETVNVQESPGTGRKKVDKKYTVSLYQLNGACTSLKKVTGDALSRLRKHDTKKVLPSGVSED